ncbi:MAG: AAA family ATPase [Planctomycetes bacterium]|nr:AAA family ATPase [Planctomycetota bacterium]
MPEPPPPLRALTKSELRALGVPPAQVGAVREAASLDALRALVDDALVRRLAPRFGAPAAAPEGTLHLLDDAQRAVVARLVTGGPYTVRGVAGTGKTQVLLHAAARRLEARPPAADLLWTFNRALADAARQAARRLAGPRARALTVETFDGWCKRFLGETRPVLDDRHPDLLALLEEAKEQARRASWSPRSQVWARPLEFWREELDLLRDPPLETLADYLTVERVGRGQKLDRAHRALVWVTHETYARLLDARGVRDWRQVRLDALRRLREARSTRYERVFVDEAQDLPPLALEVARLLAGPSVVVAFDAAQAIYTKGFRARDLGRRFTLTACYRTTAELARAAAPFRAAEADAAPTGALRAGRRPTVVTVTGRGNEAAWVADELERRLDAGAAPGDFAVLTFTRRLADAMADALERRGLPVSRSTEALDLSPATVKVATMSAAKGLEFPVVLLAPLRDADLSARADDPDERRLEEALRRRVLYVAMTRARDELILVQRRGNAARLLAELPADAVEDAGAPT